MMVVTCHLQGRQPLPWDRYPVSFGADRPTFIFQPAAPDVIWHIYLHLYCSSKYGGRDLPSSGEEAHTMGKVPCEFWADQPGFSFSGKELRQGSFQPWTAQDGASSMAGSSGCDLAHLLTPVLLLEGWWKGLAIFRGGSPYYGQVPCEFQANQPTFIFQLAAPDVIWHIYSRHRCFTGDGDMHLPSSWEVLLGLRKVNCETGKDHTKH